MRALLSAKPETQAQHGIRVTSVSRKNNDLTFVTIDPITQIHPFVTVGSKLRTWLS